MPEVGKQVTDSHEWTNMVLVFYFPSQNIYKKVIFSTCFREFTKPQRCNILSWVREQLKKGYDMKEFGMPPHFSLASSLVGAAMDDLKHEDLMQQYANPREYQN